MKTKSLLIVTAVIEAGAGLAFEVSPSALASLLLGSSLETPAATTVGRVAGAALLALGGACWIARNDEHIGAATALVMAMLFYNAATTAVLAYAGIVSHLSGIGLWPAVLVHVIMAVWCLASLQSGQT